MLKIFLRPQAETDAFEQTRYLAQDSSDVAARFASALEAALTRLAHRPHLGRPWPTRKRELRGVRRFILTDFPLSIFYRPTESAIDVLRVLHHRRKLPHDLDRG